MVNKRNGEDLRMASTARPLRWGIACALVLAVAGCGQDGMDEGTIDKRKDAWASAVNNVHRHMTEAAVDGVHQMLGKEIFSKSKMVEGNVDTDGDNPAYLKASKYHFVRQPTVSSQQACEDSSYEIVRATYNGLRNHERAYQYLWAVDQCRGRGCSRDLGPFYAYLDSFNRDVGRATHILQDSTAPAHAERFIGQWPGWVINGSHKELRKVCVDIGEAVPAGACSHALLDPGDFDWDYSSHEYHAGRRATIGLLRAIANLMRPYATYSWNEVDQAVRNVLVHSADKYTGYVDCSTLPTSDVLRPRDRDECGCYPGQICCNPKKQVCVTPPRRCQ